MDKEAGMFCRNCPIVPKLTWVKLTGTQVVTRSMLNRYRFAYEAPRVADELAGGTSLVVEVVASFREDIEVGETTTFGLFSSDESYLTLEEALARLEQCHGPVSVNLIQRLLKVRTRCGAFDSRPVKYVQ